VLCTILELTCLCYFNLDVLCYVFVLYL
jgi:hypothetical protein